MPPLHVDLQYIQSIVADAATAKPVLDHVAAYAVQQAVEHTSREQQKQVVATWCAALGDGGIRGGIGCDAPVWLLSGWHGTARFTVVDGVPDDPVAHMAAWSLMEGAISRACEAVPEVAAADAFPSEPGDDA